MAVKQKSAPAAKSAEAHNQAGLKAYDEWDVEVAVEQFRAAIQAAPNKPDYHLNLARALSRAGDFDQALRAVAEFLRLDPDSEVVERFERLFASGLDRVETLLTERMSAIKTPIEMIGAAMQMWLEYRIALGSTPLSLRKPESWAAALDYAVRKVNLRAANRQDIAALYGVSEAVLRERFNDLITMLDVMPCDYRYFVGGENPLDKLVEAAELLEQLEARFREP